MTSHYIHKGENCDGTKTGGRQFEWMAACQTESGVCRLRGEIRSPSRHFGRVKGNWPQVRIEVMDFPGGAALRGPQPAFVRGLSVVAG